MPRLNGTGPMGQGLRTGRGFGPYGHGMGRGGYGCGNCYGGGYNSQRFISPKNELIVLEDEEKILEEQLSIIREEKKALTKK